MTYSETIEQLRGRVHEEDALLQLAEEAAELSQAALKCVRVLRGTNPTPVSETGAFNALAEEVADVLVCLDVVDLGDIHQGRRKREKAERWAHRLST